MCMERVSSPLRSASSHVGAGPDYPKPSATTRPLLTSCSVGSCCISRRRPFGREARSPQVRLLHCPCTSAGFTWKPWKSAVRASRPYARSPAGSAPPQIQFLYVAPAGLATRFFRRFAHAPRFAVRSGRCDQLPGGLPPPSQRSCWAHISARRSRAPSLERLSTATTVIPLAQRYLSQSRCG